MINAWLKKRDEEGRIAAEALKNWIEKAATGAQIRRNQLWSAQVRGWPCTLPLGRNLEDVPKIQTEFVKAQTDSFNEHIGKLRSYRKSEAQLQRDRANMAIRARNYIVTADIRLVFWNEVQKWPGYAIFLPDEAAHDVARIANSIWTGGPLYLHKLDRSRAPHFCSDRCLCFFYHRIGLVIELRGLGLWLRDDSGCCYVVIWPDG
jgi:hypothetical protein